MTTAQKKHTHDKQESNWKIEQCNSFAEFLILGF